MPSWVWSKVRVGLGLAARVWDVAIIQTQYKVVPRWYVPTMNDCIMSLVAGKLGYHSSFSCPMKFVAEMPIKLKWIKSIVPLGAYVIAPTLVAWSSKLLLVEYLIWRFPKKIGGYLQIIYWLVVWLPFFIFPYIGCLIIPTDFHIFQRGWNHQPDLCS